MQKKSVTILCTFFYLFVHICKTIQYYKHQLLYMQSLAVFIYVGIAQRCTKTFHNSLQQQSCF